MMRKLAKGLTLIFGVSALGGCATMNYTGTQDCVERNGFSMNIPLISVNKRNDKYSEECATAQAATALSSMRKRDGSPDLGMYNLALSMYEQSNPRVREFMDKMLQQQGMSVEAMKFEIARDKEPVTCEKTETKGPDGKPASGFRCTPKKPAAAQ
jgi:hypothetical protein